MVEESGRNVKSVEDQRSATVHRGERSGERLDTEITMDTNYRTRCQPHI